MKYVDFDNISAALGGRRVICQRIKETRLSVDWGERQVW